MRLASADAAWLASTASAAGVRCFEVSLIEPDWEETLRALRELGSELTVGAGSILDSGGAESALEAGADFLVTPCNAPGVAECASGSEIEFVEGASTPTEILSASQRSDFVKVFPALQLGGPPYIEAVRAPLPDVRLIAAGGVSPSDASDYLAAGAELVVLGSSVVSRSELREKADTAVLSRLAPVGCL